ncbi:FAD dependent oxidoreductase [Nitrosococcus halophilus Nc 4]|uniref:FAD dependent oxidoreductase n=1 Tax=Nitrosococcus halophilus (strain Nc4) TaxID=472759 RepID=D5C0N1_NITHN|nr:glycerol-3-phosphate dehydrogenase/oxidase [Nitrosococcus halophilus]ADE16354.1 FAD dependent oxidoreductase [Nitrosococcus halophilus Nc 4]
MKRNLSELTGKEYDLVIIGGGIFGACAAWDAVLRGFSVALVERGDFSSGTSANSFKIVHGGIRYIQHGDIMRIRESCRERSALLRVAPHLVQPLPTVIPTYGHGKNGKFLLAAGLLGYDLLTSDRNLHIKDPDRRIPRGRLLSRGEVVELFPGLERNGLTGAAMFSDGQMYNPTRLVLSFLLSSAAAGAEIANYVEAINFIRSKGRVTGIEAQDKLTGEQFQIRGKVVLNATGPWAEHLLNKQLGFKLERKGTYSRDACFVIPRQLDSRHALAVLGRTRDPDALLSRNARHLFIVPWRDYSLIGVWHVVYDGNPDGFAVTEQELKAFVEEINAAYPALDLSVEEISMWNAGLLPFGENQDNATNLSYGKRSLIVDHARQHQVEGLVTLLGVRYTMARGEAAKAIDLVARKLNRRVPRPATAKIPIYGGRIEHFEAFVQQVTQRSEAPLPIKALRALLHNHGSEYDRILRYGEENSAWVETIADSTVIKAEVLQAVREEMALKLSDIIFRRTDLATGEYPGNEALQTCAQLMAAELGWTAKHQHQEIEEVKRIFPIFGQVVREDSSAQVGVAI